MLIKLKAEFNTNAFRDSIVQLRLSIFSNRFRKYTLMAELFEKLPHKLMGFAQFMDFECHVASRTAHAIVVKSDVRYRRAVCTYGYSYRRRH